MSAALSGFEAEAGYAEKPLIASPISAPITTGSTLMIPALLAIVVDSRERRSATVTVALSAVLGLVVDLDRPTRRYGAILVMNHRPFGLGGRCSAP